MRARASIVAGESAPKPIPRRPTRAATIFSSPSNAPPQVLINGIIDSEYDLTLLDTREVIGFEYYTPTNTPLKYNRTAIGRDSGAAVCGTVLLWLR